MASDSRSDPMEDFVFLLVKRTRGTVPFSLCLLVALPVAAQSVASGAASASAAAATRAAFLKIVDRPRVPLSVEARSLAAPEPGLSAQHISKGGIETYLTAAIDQRIAAAVSVRGVQSFDWALKHGAWDSRAWTIRGAIDAATGEAKVRATAAFVRSFYDVVTPGVYEQFDGPAMLPLIAPRPLLVINGDSDPKTPMGGVRLSVAAAEQAYRRSGAPEHFQLHIMESTGHEDTPDVPNLVMDWFVKWLQPRSN